MLTVFSVAASAAIWCYLTIGSWYTYDISNFGVLSILFMWDYFCFLSMGCISQSYNDAAYLVAILYL
jgi:hypothetical protein